VYASIPKPNLSKIDNATIPTVLPDGTNHWIA